MDYPTSLSTDGRLNVSNRLAKDFYEARGVKDVHPALDVQDSIAAEVELMRTKYCLRHELSLCPKQRIGEKATPLILYSQGGHRLRAEFDCTRCEMIIKEA